jgi:cell division septation protein DedD
MGLSLDTDIQLEDRLAFEPLEPVALEHTKKDASRLRTDLQLQQAREENAAISRDAARLERFPTVSSFADYGTTGLGIRDSLPTHTVGISVAFPVFDGGRRKAKAAEAASKWRQEQIRTAELREQTELETRMAIENLHSAEAQVQVSMRGVRLSNRELTAARERYEAGVSSNLEVTDAQSRLERARDNHLDAVFNYNQAMIAFGRASGTLDRMLERMAVVMGAAGPVGSAVMPNGCAAEPLRPWASDTHSFVPPAPISMAVEARWIADEPPAIGMAERMQALPLPDPIPTPAPMPSYAVQVGAFRAQEAAEQFVGQLIATYHTGCVVQREDQAVWRVLVGLGSSKSAAESLAAAIRNRDSLPAFPIVMPVSADCR